MRIAFTGSHGTGKTTAARILRKVINEEMEAVTIAPLGSVTRNVLSWGSGSPTNSGPILSPEGNSFQLACIYERRRMMMAKGSMSADFVISERWAMDETAYQLHKAKKQMMDRDTGFTLRVCQMEMDWEYHNYWDRIYYIPADQRPVDGDGTRPTDKEYQVDIDELIKMSLNMYKRSTKIKTIPTSLEDLEDYFRKEVESWKVKKK